jgi:hypothetical protein
VKPLLIVPSTEEDLEIWGKVSPGTIGNWRSRLFWLTRAADRRDAALMYSYERAKANLISRDGLQRYIDTRAMVNAIMSERVEPAE